MVAVCVVAVAKIKYLSYPNPGTRFRPLSLELPQPLFPIAGSPWLQHHIEAIVKVRLSNIHNTVTRPYTIP